MMDNKVKNAITETASAIICFVCGDNPKDLNCIKNFPTNFLTNAEHLQLESVKEADEQKQEDSRILEEVEFRKCRRQVAFTSKWIWSLMFRAPVNKQIPHVWLEASQPKNVMSRLQNDQCDLQIALKIQDRRRPKNTIIPNVQALLKKGEKPK